MLVKDGLFLDKNHELYEALVPEDNELRQLLELSDFSFIYEEIEQNYCTDNGRNASSPVVMFKYLILKTLYKLSDVDVIKRTRYDLSFKYFLGLDPMEIEFINPATLTKFRRKRLKDKKFLDLLIANSVTIAKKHNLIKGTKIIVDSTHVNSRYNSKSQREILIEESKKLRKVVYSFDETYKEKMPKKANTGVLEDHIEYCQKLVNQIKTEEKFEGIPAVKEQLSYLDEIIEDNLEHLKTSFDEDAMIGHKTYDSSFYGYKTHIAITEDRIITAATVTSGEKHDGKELVELIEQSKENGVEINEVIGDGAYSEMDNLTYAKDKEIKLISKLSNHVVKGNTKRETFEYNKDAGMYVCPAGHMANKKVKAGPKNYKTHTYFFDIEMCKICPKREGCYKEGAKSKSYSVSIKKDEFKEHMAFMETDEFKESAKERYKIEAINGHLKNNYDFRTSKTRGIFGMEIQAATTIYVANLKRILTLMKK